MSDFCLYFWKTVLLDLSFLIVHLLKILALWICHPTASLIVSREKSAINLFGIPLYMMNPFSYCFQDFLSLSFSASIMKCLAMDLIACILLGICWTSMYRLLFFIKVWEFSAIIEYFFLLPSLSSHFASTFCIR